MQGGPAHSHWAHPRPGPPVPRPQAARPALSGSPRPRPHPSPQPTCTGPISQRALRVMQNSTSDQGPPTSYSHAAEAQDSPSQSSWRMCGVPQWQAARSLRSPDRSLPFSKGHSHTLAGPGPLPRAPPEVHIQHSAPSLPLRDTRCQVWYVNAAEILIP